MSVMKILAISCSHGKLPSGLKQFIKKNSIDMIISLGDHCDGDEIRSLEFQNWDALTKAVKEGKYYEGLKHILGKDFDRIYRDFAISGKNVLEELDSYGIPVLALYGNNDYMDNDNKELKLDFPTFEEICEDSENLLVLDNQKYEVSGFRLCGIGGYRGPSTKEGTNPKSEERNKKLRDRLENILKGWKHNKIILIGHDQVKDTEFDDIDYPESPMHGKHLGDEIIREYIEKFKPIMYIGGHMHEHHGTTKLGETTIIATGFGQKGQCIVLDIPSLKVEKVQL